MKCFFIISTAILLTFTVFTGCIASREADNPNDDDSQANLNIPRSAMDSDGDGVPDDVDIAPDDPSRGFASDVPNSDVPKPELHFDAPKLDVDSDGNNVPDDQEKNPKGPLINW